MFKPQSPSKYSPFDAIHLSRDFSTAQNSFWTRFWSLSLLLIFLFHIFHISKTLPLRTFLIRETIKVVWFEIRWIGRVGHGVDASFGQKFLNTLCSVGRCTLTSSIIKWANTLKESSKTIHWSWTQPLITTPAGALIQIGS